MAFVVSEIHSVGVIGIDAALRLTETAVPADEIDCVTEIVPPGAFVARGLRVPIPGGVHCLGVTICGGGTRAGKDPEEGGPGRL